MNMSYKDTYNNWLNHPNLDVKSREEMLKMSEKDIENAFYTNIKFGTAGMRGVMGVGTDRINIYTIRKATLGFANYLNANNKDGVAIGYDNRHNSKDYAYDCAALLASKGIKTYLFDSLRPTPELSFATRYFKCDGGIMITASHNPKQYNGYKLYDETGCQLIPELAEKVTAEVNKIEDPLSITIGDYDKSLINIVNTEVDEAYYKEVMNISLRKDLPNKDKLKIVFSPEHGASNIPVRETLRRAGFDVYVVEEQAIPDGDFPNTKTPNPEEAGAYEGVIELARKVDADLLLVCDPDGDRMGVGVKKDGDYHVFNGNQTGALLLEYILSTRKELGMEVDHPVMFNTIVTSDIGEAVANYYGVECEKTLTGFKFIGNKVKQYEENGKKTYVFGYEESYGSLIKPFVRDKDATQACMMLAEEAVYYHNQGKTLYDVLLGIFDKVGAYFDAQMSIMLPGADGAEKLAAIMKNIRENPFSIDGYKTVKIEDYKTQKTTYSDGRVEDLTGFDVTDAIKYYLEDGSFIAIRPSGTEPKCKIYLSTKDATYDAAVKKCDDFKKIMSEIIK